MMDAFLSIILSSGIMSYATLLLSFVAQNPALAAEIAAVFLVSTFVLWWLFAHLMMLRDYVEQEAKGHWYYHPLKAIGYVLFAFGYTYDVVYNWLIASWVFSQIPREATLTARLLRYLHGSEPGLWRRPLALLTCTKLIEPWDPGHCDLWKLALAHRVI